MAVGTAVGLPICADAVAAGQTIDAPVVSEACGAVRCYIRQA